MPNIIFTKGAETFTFSRGRAYPVDDPEEVSVVTDLSEELQLYAYEKGIIILHHNIYFNNLSQSDYDNLNNWLLNIAIGPKNTFVYTDEDGDDHTVRLINTEDPLKEISYDNFEGTIELREEA